MTRALRVALPALLVVAGLATSAVSSATSSSDSGGVARAASAAEPAVRGERIVIAAPTTTAPPAPTHGIADPLLRAVFELTNAHRANVGLPALRHNALLSQAAQSHSDDMARRNTLTHYGVNGESPGDRIAATGYSFRSWAENAAMGFRTAESVMNGWMNSSGHRANILRSSVTEIGLGIAYSSSGAPYWTQVFAAPRG